MRKPKAFTTTRTPRHPVDDTLLTTTRTPRHPVDATLPTTAMSSTKYALCILDMPPEVRFQIYRDAILSPDREEWPDPLGFERLWGAPPATHPAMGRTTALLTTNRLIHYEASQILYRESRFVFSDYPYILADLADIDGVEGLTAEEIIGHEDSPMRIMELPAFLRQIGARNRSNIRTLELQLQRGLCWLGARIDREWVLAESFKLLMDAARGNLKLVIRFMGNRQTDFAFFYNVVKGLEDPVFRKHTAADTFALLKGAGELQVIPTSLGWYEDELYDRLGPDGADTYKIVTPDEMQAVADYLVRYLAKAKAVPAPVPISDGVDGADEKADGVDGVDGKADGGNGKRTRGVRSPSAMLQKLSSMDMKNARIGELLGERQTLFQEQEAAMETLQRARARLYRNQEAIDRAQHPCKEEDGVVDGE